MPARTRNNQQNMLDDNFQVTYQVGNNLTELLTCKYLSQRLFKAEIQNANKDPCPICLEEVNCMHCAMLVRAVVYFYCRWPTKKVSRVMTT